MSYCILYTHVTTYSVLPFITPVGEVITYMVPRFLLDGDIPLPATRWKGVYTCI